jgi:hypothetical protein
MARAGASSELNAALDSGAAVNSRCPMNGSTALIAAAKRGHMDIVKNLVSRNAALSLANDIGDTAVDDAFSGGNLLIAAFLLVHGGKSAHARGWSYLVSSVGLNFISSSAVIRFLAAYTLSSWALLIHSAFRLFRCRKTVHVWQAGGADHRIEYMYEPVVSTISQGFSTHPCDVDRQVGCYDWSCVSPGAWFIWVGVTHVRDVPWIYLRLRGVRTIYYQSEPVDAGQYIRLTSDKVEEIWDYSHKNIDVASEKPGAPVMRYVPPGAHQRENAEHFQRLVRTPIRGPSQGRSFECVSEPSPHSCCCVDPRNCPTVEALVLTCPCPVPEFVSPGRSRVFGDGRLCGLVGYPFRICASPQHDAARTRRIGFGTFRPLLRKV